METKVKPVYRILFIIFLLIFAALIISELYTGIIFINNSSSLYNEYKNITSNKDFKYAPSYRYTEDGSLYINKKKIEISEKPEEIIIYPGFGCYYCYEKNIAAVPYDSGLFLKYIIVFYIIDLVSYVIYYFLRFYHHKSKIEKAAKLFNICLIVIIVLITLLSVTFGYFAALSELIPSMLVYAYSILKIVSIFLITGSNFANPTSSEMSATMYGVYKKSC